MQDNDQRTDMKERIGFILLILIVIFIMAWSDFGKSPRVYNCELAEISPDFPIEVREECRKMRLEEWRKENETRSKIWTSNFNSTRRS